MNHRDYFNFALISKSGNKVIDINKYGSSSNNYSHHLENILARQNKLDNIYDIN